MDNFPIVVKTEFKKSCEICFKVLDDISNGEVPDDSLKDMIEILFIQLEITFNHDTIICLQCTNSFRQAFNFKTTCIETEDVLVPLIATNGSEAIVAEIFNKANLLSDSEMQTQTLCRTCRNSIERSELNFFSKFLEKHSNLEVFEKHIPEMNLNGVQDAVICIYCQNIVQEFSKFLSVITETNGGISFKDHKLPSTINFPAKDENNPAYRKIFNNGQWIDVKEESDEESYYEYIKKNGPKRRRRNRKVHKCQICGFETKNISTHSKLHKDLSQVRNYKCSECSYVSKYLSGLKRHIKIHNRISEQKTKTRILKCKVCPFQTVEWKAFDKHLKDHPELTKNELVRYKCEYCNYGSHKKYYLDLHMKKHEPTSIEGKRQCPLCNYWTRFKNHLRRHMAYHDVDKTKSNVC